MESSQKSTAMHGHAKTYVFLGCFRDSLKPLQDLIGSVESRLGKPAVDDGC